MDAKTIDDTPQEGRVGLFSGIGRVLSNLFRREIKEGAEDLEEIINTVLAAEKAQFAPDYHSIQTFCCVIGDNNDIHRSVPHAARHGYSDIIVPGTQLAAMSEQYINGVTKALEEVWGVSLILGGINIEFREPLYPGNPINWQVVDHRGNGTGIELTIEGKANDMEVITAVAKLIREKYSELPRLIGEPEGTDRYTIRETDLDAFYRSIGEEPKAKIPWSYTTSFVTSILLDMSRGGDRTPSGINRRMEFEFYEAPQLGKIAVDVYLKRNPRKIRDNFLYQFDAVCSQKHRPLTYGKIIVISDKEFKTSQD